jgi:hypothetical protein
MSDPREELCNLLMANVVGLRANLDRMWTLAQALPLGAERVELEKIHQSMAQQSLILKKNLLGM